MNPSHDIDMQHPAEMAIDADELMADGDKAEVAIIGSDDSDSDVSALKADDYEAMKAVAFPPLLEDPPIIEDQVSTWEIIDWRHLPKKHFGPQFMAGGFPWRVMMFPSGNNASSDYCSFYLESALGSDMPDNWSCCVQFGLVLWNKHDPAMFVHHTANHRFNASESDWGFTKFYEVRKLFAPGFDTKQRPMVENDAANMTAYVRIVTDETGVLWHNFVDYDSKKETGFVGLKNQGATCYLNSLIQSLYFTNAFRKAVYQIPTDTEDDLQNSAYTLQRLFYQLQSSSNAVGTNELTKSFGWETKHVFEQQDVQELSRLLMDKLEVKMKNTEAEKLLSNLFSAKVRTYISCINVPYESRRVEDFWDIQLNVSGMKTLEDSFRDYIQVETMDGENQYFASDEYKLQDARKGVIFESFPQVLHLQLKRFQYDFERDAMMKLNDRHEFPETFDASPYLADEIDRSESWIYQLHGVLVHSGDLNAGHYYAFIKPAQNGWWYKYDDDKVTKATLREVLEENYGGELPAYTNPITQQTSNAVIRQNSAYMLVYIRQSRLDQVLVPVSQDDTPAHLRRKLEEEAAIREAKRKEREEQHLYLNVRVVSDDTFREHSGFDLTAFEMTREKYSGAPRQYRLLRSSNLQELIEIVAAELGADAKRLRFWAMVGRQNKTNRPDQPIMDNQLTIDEAYLKHSGKNNELRLWAEVAEEISDDGSAIWPILASMLLPPNENIQGAEKPDLILLLLKWFDVRHQKMVGMGHIYMSKEKKVEDLTPIIMARMGWTEKADERIQLRLCEEIKPDMIEPMKPKQTLKAAELQDGDIVAFQELTHRGYEIDQALVADTNGTMAPPQPIPSDAIEDLRLYYDFLKHKRIIKLKPHPSTSSKSTHESFELIMSSRYNYDEIVGKVGRAIHVAPTHLRLWTANMNDSPKSVVKRGQAQTLQTILSTYTQYANVQKNDSLLFEVLDMSLSELETKKSLKIVWLSEGVSKEDVYDILVPKSGTVTDLVNALVTKAQLEDEATAGPIRIYEVSSNRFHSELGRSDLVAAIGGYVHVVAERIPSEDVGVDPREFMQAIHFQSENNKAHGMPFKFRVKTDEPFSETRKRLEKRTGIKGKSFEKIKFAVLKRAHAAQPIYLKDDDILWDVASHDDDLLGLDHPDRSRSVRGGAGDMFLR